MRSYQLTIQRIHVLAFRHDLPRSQRILPGLSERIATGQFQHECLVQLPVQVQESHRSTRVQRAQSVNSDPIYGYRFGDKPIGGVYPSVRISTPYRKLHKSLWIIKSNWLKSLTLNIWH